MDVPAWHPANEDASAARRIRELSGSAAAKRVEFKVMAGSSADTSTEAGRELLSDMRGDGGGAAWTGRGFFDASDRLYLLEQKRLSEEGEQREQQKRVEELRRFRSNALKLQAQKPPSPAVAVPLVPDAPKKPLVGAATPLVVIKPKKRPATEARDGSSVVKVKKKTKKEAKAASSPKAKQTQSTTVAKDQAKPAKPAAGPSKGESELKAPVAPAAAAAALVVGYSSSSDSDA